MEEGSPSSACKQVRFSKRFRIEDACELEPSPDSVPNADLMEDLEVPLRQNSFVGTGNFRDKLMNEVNLVKNVGIDVDSLDDNYADMTDAEDVVVSRGDKGPTIQFSE